MNMNLEQTMPSQKNMTEAEFLKLTRKIMRDEMYDYIYCKNQHERDALASTWRYKYSERFAKELKSLAKNRAAARKVAFWKLEDFEKPRKRVWK